MNQSAPLKKSYRQIKMKKIVASQFFPFPSKLCKLYKNTQIRFKTSPEIQNHKKLHQLRVLNVPAKKCHTYSTNLVYPNVKERERDPPIKIDSIYSREQHIFPGAKVLLCSPSFALIYPINSEFWMAGNAGDNTANTL